jgi:hypothetical protein
MAKRKGSRRHKGFTLPLAVVGGFAPLAINAMQDYKVGGVAHVGRGLSVRLTGYRVDTGKFEPNFLMQGLFPILGGIIVHKIAGRLGVNRALAGAGIPFIRI